MIRILGKRKALGSISTSKICQERLEHLAQLVATEIAISQDSNEQSRPDGLPRMSRNDRGASVLVAKEMVASFHADHLKADLSERRNEILARDAWQLTHAAIVIL